MRVLMLLRIGYPAAAGLRLTLSEPELQRKGCSSRAKFGQLWRAIIDSPSIHVTLLAMNIAAAAAELADSLFVAARWVALTGEQPLTVCGSELGGFGSAGGAGHARPNRRRSQW